MPELRKVRYVNNYWHVVSDEHSSIIGSLLHTDNELLPWRAEYTGTMQNGWTDMKIGYLKTEEEAMDFLANALNKGRTK